MLQLHTRSCVSFIFIIFYGFGANGCSFLNLHLAASCQADKDGDILAAVKTRMSVVSGGSIGR